MSWNPLGFCIRETGKEPYFRATEAFGVNSEDVSVWELGGLCPIWALCRGKKNDVANVSL